MPIPLAIVAAALLISAAATTFAAWQNKRSKEEAKKAEEAGDALAEAMKAEQYRVMSAPGLEKETMQLTDHIATFEQVVDPLEDLEFAEKLTGERESKPPPEIEPVERSEETIKKCEAYRELFRRPASLDKILRLMGSVDPEDAAATLAGLQISGYSAIALAHTPGIIAEAASLGQIESVTWTIQSLLNASGLPDIVKTSNLLPYEISVFQPARYHYNSLYTPLKPMLRDLPAMLARRQISEDEYLKQAAFQGFSGRWAAAAWNTFLKLPEFRQLQPMLWRGLIDEVGFKDALLRQGWHPDVVDELLNLAWLIPPYPDLTKLMVREIITPEEFNKFMLKQGFSEMWAAGLYEAHFRLPSPDYLIDAFHRGVISEAELNKYVFWHDYKPTARPDISKSDIAIMAGIRKTLIPRVDLRRAWLQGEITDADLELRYGWLGYEDDAALMARIQKAVALTPQRNTVRNMFLRALRQGVYSESVVRARLKELRYPGAAVDLLIEAENVRREIGAVEVGEEPRILSTTHITRAYKGRLITREAAMEMLTAQGWDPGAADMLLMLSEPAPEKVDQLTAIKTAAAALYREGYMEREEFIGWLRVANYGPEDISQILISEDLRYRLDFTKDLQGAAIEAYRKDILTLDELKGELLRFGLQPERAAALLAKEAYKKLPKPKPA